MVEVVGMERRHLSWERGLLSRLYKTSIRPTKQHHKHVLNRTRIPSKSTFAESFNSRFRDEFLNTVMFTTSQEARIPADRSFNEHT